MKLTYRTDFAPLSRKIEFPAGTLFYFGCANLSWIRVGEVLATGSFPAEIRGNFSFIWQGNQETIAAVDHVATYPIFFTPSAISHIFYELKVETPGTRANLKVKWQMEFLGGQSLSEETTVKEIRRILPGHYMRGGKQHSY